MPRPTRCTIGWFMVAVAVVAYLSAYPELAALLGIFTASLLFVAPVAVTSYIVCRLALGNHGPSNPRP